MLNTVVLSGRLTGHPELRMTQTNAPVTSFTLAVERDFADSSGKRAVDFIDCVAWRGTAEFVSKYFAKGQQMAVTGRLQLRDWTDKDGNKRRNAEVIVDRAYFCGGKTEAKDDFAEITDDGDLPF